MAGKNGKKDGVGVEEDEVKAEAPTVENVVAAKYEAPKPEAAPAGEDTYTSQQTFGQKTYDQQMKIESQYVGLNRTDEISQLGGASKTEVDLAEMKIFSTERIGNETYAAILRGDTTAVESLAGLNSDRRLTEGQILVLLKAKQEADEDLAKRIAAEAYYTQELHDKKKAADDDDSRYDTVADQQNYASTNPTTMTPGAVDGNYEGLAQGWHPDHSYTNAAGGTTDNEANYHGPDGSTVWNNGLFEDKQGNTVTTTGVIGNAAAGTLTVPADPQTGDPETVITVDPSLPPADRAAGVHDASVALQNVVTGGETLNLTADQQADADAHRTPAAGAPAPASAGGRAGPASIASAAATGAVHTAELAAQAASARDGAGTRATRYTLSGAAQAEFLQSRTGLTSRIMSTDPDYHRFMALKNNTVGNMSSAQREQAGKQFSAEDFIAYKRQIGKGAEADRLQSEVDAIRIRAESQRQPNPAHPDSQSLADRPASAAPAPAPTDTETAAIASQIAVTPAAKEAVADAAPAAAKGVDTADGLFYDSTGAGYFDEFGGYYDEHGGYDDGMGGYYAADGSYYDPNGGYQWPDGSFEDKYGNYVDKDGNLLAKDGSYYPADPENKDKYTFMLRENAKLENSANPFEPDTSKQVPGATDAFMKLPGSWQEKRALERAAETPAANPDAAATTTGTAVTTPDTGKSSWFVAKDFFSTQQYAVNNFTLPIFDPMTINPSGTNPLSPTAPSIGLA